MSGFVKKYFFLSKKIFFVVLIFFRTWSIFMFLIVFRFSSFSSICMFERACKFVRVVDKNFFWRKKFFTSCFYFFFLILVLKFFCSRKFFLEARFGWCDSREIWTRLQITCKKYEWPDSAKVRLVNFHVTVNRSYVTFTDQYPTFIGEWFWGRKF